MKQFVGFPNKTDFTSLPNLFFSTLLPQISDIAELKVTIYVLSTLYRKRGYPRFITQQEMLANKSLVRSLKQEKHPVTGILQKALATAVRRGSILQLKLDKHGTPEEIYFLNTEADKKAITKIRSGELILEGREITQHTCHELEEQSNLFTAYEDNIGMLVPIIAEELAEAESTYPTSWIQDAIKEAAKQNKRSWSYISAILEQWSIKGKSDGTHQRNPKKADPDKYIKGQYGHMVRR